MTETATTTTTIIIAIIAAQAQRPATDLSHATVLADLGLDSLAMVEAVFAIEEAFDITIPFAESGDGPGFDTSTIAAIIAGVETLVAQKAA